ncbi:MAG: hypothetical protein WA705_21025 [Candidatus Ozemobacteraceae bacterium]
MKRLVTAAILTIALANPVWAFDRETLRNTLEDLSQGVSQSAYALNETAGTAERDGYDIAAAKSDHAQAELAKTAASIENAADLTAALEETRSFGRGDAVRAYTAGVAVKALRERATFLKISEPAVEQALIAAADELIKAETLSVDDSKKLLSLSQERLIQVQLPVADAVISCEDTKDNRRVDALKRMLARHDCNVSASAVDTSGDKPQTNFLISGKKFVIEALMRNFKGSEVKNDLRAILVITAGGFWGKSSITVNVTPKSGSSETGTLGWYQAVLEKDPFKYMVETDYAKLAQLGKVETIGGEQKLRIKNAVVDLWVVGPNGTQRDAVYANHVEFGDVYTATR